MTPSELPPAEPSAANVRPFSVVSALTPVSPGHFEAFADPEWTIAGRPNGGYLLALLGRAAVAIGPHEHVISASAVYLDAPAPGTVQVEAELLRAGRSASHVRARLRQEGRVCVEALVVTSRLDPGAQPFWSAGAPDFGTGDAESAVRMPSVNPAGLAVPVMGQVDLRIDRDHFGWGRGRPSGRGELHGWLSLSNEESFDAISLLYAVDAFPPATFDIEPTGWVPTIELTAYVRALPAPGPVRVLQRAHLIDSQRVDEACWVRDARGRLVAHATQLAGIRLG